MENYLFRVGGRLHNAGLTSESNYPVILTKALYISHLILRDIHQQIGHAGRNHMLHRHRLHSDCRLYRKKLGEKGWQRVILDNAPFIHRQSAQPVVLYI